MGAGLPAKRFRGMFAFAIFDERSGSLFLARDQLGIKPLHYICRKDGVVFASELKALVAAFGNELRHRSRSALVASMLYYWVPSRVLGRGIVKLQPGTWASSGPTARITSSGTCDIAEAAAAAAEGPHDLREVIEDSVDAHLVADVPVSSFLSGGLDSSIIDSAGQTGKSRRSTPIPSPFVPRTNDSRPCRTTPSTPGRSPRQRDQLHEIQIAPDVVELLPELVDILDEPIGDPAAINTLLMCEAARDAGVKVILSGMGADELFGGYRKHVACVMAEQVPTAARASPAERRRRRRPAAGDRGRPGLSLCPMGQALPDVRRATRGGRVPAQLQPLRPRRASRSDRAPSSSRDVDDILGEHFEVYSDNFLPDHVNRMCLADARLFLPGLNLTYTDRASMAASTEVRVPFVDPLVFRAAFSLAGENKVSGRPARWPSSRPPTPGCRTRSSTDPRHRSRPR